MDEELRAIRAQETVADEVYDNHYKQTDDDSDWFINAMLDISARR
jgi:hypothetical protein